MSKVDFRTCFTGVNLANVLILDLRGCCAQIPVAVLQGHPLICQDPRHRNKSGFAEAQVLQSLAARTGHFAGVLSSPESGAGPEPL